MTDIGVTVGAMVPIRPNLIWATDFEFDTLAAGRTIKLLSIIDEYARECLAIEIDHSIDADQVVALLDRLALTLGTPVYVRLDNGPEFVAYAVRDWCRFTGTRALFIDLGSPRQNGWIESYNARLRDELLNSWRFDSPTRGQLDHEDWRTGLQHHPAPQRPRRPQPAEFALQWSSLPTTPKPHSDWTTNRAPHLVPYCGPAKPPQCRISPSLTTKMSTHPASRTPTQPPNACLDTDR